MSKNRIKNLEKKKERFEKRMNGNRIKRLENKKIKIIRDSGSQPDNNEPSPGTDCSATRPIYGSNGQIVGAEPLYPCAQPMCAQDTMNRVEEYLVEVSNTDCTCWFLHRDVINRMPQIDLNLNKLGWGVDTAMAYLSNKQNRKILRNYKHTIIHPASTNYDKNVAGVECNKFLQKFMEEN